ncbi:MAG TPA: hypothetical protein DCX07_06635 [Phycisphaerales bacterium]|nr:hypothetical protein [Phycisphaerales bacterium]
MSKWLKRSLVAMAAVVLVGMVVAPVRAAPVVVISDTFTSTGSEQYNIFKNHRTPNVTNLPGLTWNGESSANTFWGAFISASWRGWNNNTVSFGHAEKTDSIGWGAVGLGTYNDADVLTISADLRLGGSSTTGNQGIGLGFWGTLPTATDASDRLTGFTGLFVTRTGLTLYENGTAGTSVSLTGTVGTHMLSYDVNVATGAISNVTFAGNPVSGFSSSAFKTAATENAGLVSSGVSSGYNGADNFTVLLIPEPATMALLGLGGLGVLIRKNRRA